MTRHCALSLSAIFLLLLPTWVYAVEFTGINGGGQPVNTMQPSLGLNYIVHLNYDDDSEAGEVTLWAGNFAPGGWAFARGQLLSIAQNTALFGKLGNTYGGNGVNTFALPDLRGRTAIGDGQGAGLSNWPTGAANGVEQVTLTVNQMPAHEHSLPAGGDTGVTGGAVPVSTIQPALAMNYAVALQGVLPDPNTKLTTTPFLGQVRLFAGTSTPAGYASADGQFLSAPANPDLFGVLGTNYGGDGVNTFALPDLRGRAVLGAGQGLGLTNRALGEPLGAESSVLTLDQLAPHEHTLPPSPDLTATTGGGQPIDNMQPSLPLRYIINIDGLFPSRDSDVGEPFMGQILLFAGDFAPKGWAFCDGQLIPIAQNTALFSILGTAYGGNGQTTFALPDLRGRLPVGTGQGPGLEDRLLGEVFGTQTESLNVDELPPHNHTVPEPSSIALSALAAVFVVAASGKSHAPR